MIPYYILAIEDETDRAYMTALFFQYQKLMMKGCVTPPPPWRVPKKCISLFMTSRPMSFPSM